MNMSDTPATAPADSPVTICTLWENDFHKGVATLVNSLSRAGYRGTVWAGYRGNLPPWSGVGIEDQNGHTFEVGGIRIQFKKLETSIHFSQYKAIWMAHIMEELAPAATGIYYFDPDIFVLASWSFFEEWLSFGIAACEDSHSPLNASHPVVRRWQLYLRQIGKDIRQAPEASLNSGLLGVPRASLAFLQDWQTVITAAQRDFNLGSLLKTSTRANLFLNIDQDALTMTTCFSPHPVSWVGVDGMGFDRGLWLTLHAYMVKPWRRKVIRDLLQHGRKPDQQLRLYWEFAGGPIPVESRLRLQVHRFLIPAAALLSRFYQRT